MQACLLLWMNPDASAHLVCHLLPQKPGFYTYMPSDRRNEAPHQNCISPLHLWKMMSRPLRCIMPFFSWHFHLVPARVFVRATCKS